MSLDLYYINFGKVFTILRDVINLEVAIKINRFKTD